MLGHGIEQLPPPSTEGSVLVDVGGSRGALVVYAPELFHGVELEIRGLDEAWDGTHTAVRRRELRDAVTFAGVFGSLPAGDYELRTLGADVHPGAGAVRVSVTVTGGEVTQVQWPGDPSSVPDAHAGAGAAR